MPPVFRFAPSPNGYLHLGHALSVLLNVEKARAAGGRMLLRIEDIDTSRCRPEYEAAIYEDLGWLGVAWEQPIRRQSEHFADYGMALDRLDAMGLLYPSFESRAEIAGLVAARQTRQAWPHDPDGVALYPGDAKQLPQAERDARKASGAPYALRLDMAAAIKRAGPLSWSENGSVQAANPAAWGDVVLARKDVPASYHLAVTVDDAHQGITDVVRGCDLFHCTSVHRLLQALLGLPAPRYHHHRLIVHADGHKLSKSTKATAIRELRAAGATPADIRMAVGLD